MLAASWNAMSVTIIRATAALWASSIGEKWRRMGRR